MSNSTNIHLFLPTCIDFKKSSKNLTGIFYQMDHIWWAPSRLKKTYALIFLEKLAILLRQDFLKTLYVDTIQHNNVFYFLTESGQVRYQAFNWMFQRWASPKNLAPRQLPNINAQTQSLLVLNSRLHSTRFSVSWPIESIALKVE